MTNNDAIAAAPNCCNLNHFLSDGALASVATRIAENYDARCRKAAGDSYENCNHKDDLQRYHVSLQIGPADSIAQILMGRISRSAFLYQPVEYSERIQT